MKRILFTLAALFSAGFLQAQEIGLYTDAGRSSEANEDACDRFIVGTDRFCVVCDGVGGAVGGRLASRTAVHTIRTYLGKHPVGDSLAAIEAALAEAMHAADDAIRQRVAADSTLKGMASTCLIALVRHDTVYYSHAGDCRLYRIAGGRPVQLTRDDSYMDLLIAQGEITPKEAKKHPMRRAIYNALGVDEMTPNFCGSGCRLGPGETVLLCSDGLYEELNDARIGRIVRREKGRCMQLAQRLVRAADKAGGRDNITAVVIRTNY